MVMTHCRVVIAAAALASLSQADTLTNPADALTDTSCWTTGKALSDPDQITPRGKLQTSAKNCAVACINMPYCEKFSWDPDSNPTGNCWLLGNSASITEAERADVISGPKDCTKVVTDGSGSSGPGGNGAGTGSETSTDSGKETGTTGTDSGKETGTTDNKGSAGTIAAVSGGSLALIAVGVGGYVYVKNKKGKNGDSSESSGDSSDA